MPGIKESKEALSAIRVAVEKIAAALADGWQLLDMTVAVGILTDPVVKAGLEDIELARSEFGELKKSEIARLVEHGARETAEALEAAGL